MKDINKKSSQPNRSDWINLWLFPQRCYREQRLGEWRTYEVPVCQILCVTFRSGDETEIDGDYADNQSSFLLVNLYNKIWQ